MQQMRQQQVKGQMGESLYDDIRQLNQSGKHFDEPVRTFADLPMEGNHDGDIRVVTSQNKAYIWDEDTTAWVSSVDVYTKNIAQEIILSIDGQTEINTRIKVGVIDGIISTDTVKLDVNGMSQNPVRDYVVRIDSDFNCVIEWKSRDFQLEISDTINLSYDIIKLS